LGQAARDRIAELERALRADAGGNALAALILRALSERGRIEELCRQLELWVEGAVAAEPIAEVDEGEFERAFAAAEPELAEMITPDSVAEEAALFADAPEERSQIASSGAFATRTMAELLERQGDRRGAARIRAVLGASGEGEPPARGDAAVVAKLERWLENVRRLQP
jgi:hypothetical protein